jgi:hypothetical protein
MGYFIRFAATVPYVVTYFVCHLSPDTLKVTGGVCDGSQPEQAAPMPDLSKVEQTLSHFGAGLAPQELSALTAR